MEFCKLCNKLCHLRKSPCMALHCIDQLSEVEFKKVITSSKFATHVIFEEIEDLKTTIASAPHQQMVNKPKKKDDES